MSASTGFDWQFLVVTAAALWGLWILLRPFLPRRRKDEEAAAGACPRCTASGSCASSAAKSGGSGSGLVTLGSGGMTRMAQGAGLPRTRPEPRNPH